MGDTETIHKVKHTITDMVFMRLPFLAITDNNKELISMFIVDVFFELDVCFRKGLLNADPALEEINEENYNFVQKSIIADIVCCYIILIKMMGNIGGVADRTGGNANIEPQKFLKRAEAGSVTVEWEQFDLNKASLAMSGEKLLDRYKKNAIRKALTLGCIIDICDDCSLQAKLQIEGNLMPFKVVSFDNDCGCGKGIPERG